MKTTLLIPTLNEVVGLKHILPRLKISWVDQIIFADGDSQDGTQELINQFINLEAKDKGLLHIQKMKGLRQAYNEVFDLIQGDIVITFSPDGNCIPEIIPSLIQEMQKGFDLVVVSRYLHNAKSEDDDVITSFGNWFFTKTVNLLYQANYTDVMGIFRAFKKDIVTQLALKEESSFQPYEKAFFTKLSWEPLMSVRAAAHQLKIGEIPGDEPARIGGERKLQIIRWGLAYYLQFFTEGKISQLGPKENP